MASRHGSLRTGGRCLLAILAWGVFALAGGGEPSDAQELPTLRFTAIPDQDASRLRARFGPLAEHLSRKLGVPVEYVPATRYEDSVELFKHGDVQLAWFGGLTGVQARHAVPGARAIAQGAEDPDFRSYFIAHRDTGLSPSETFPLELAGKRFAFGSAGSTSGRLMPEHFIRRASGRAPDEFFESVTFSGSHDRTAELVESKRFDAGAINYKVYERRVAEGQTDPEQVLVIWETPPYPDYNFTAHPLLEERYGPGFVDRLRQELVDLRDPQLLAAFPRSALIPAENREFESIRKLALELGFIRPR